MPTVTLPDGTPFEIAVDELVIAGWAGRDRAAVDHHIAELEALGVAPPSQVPLFYRVSAALLTTAPRVQMLGGESSGEAEAVLLAGEGGELFVGIASDHTDRAVEAYSVAVSKQMCAKPMGPVVWRYSDVADHWDELVLRAVIETDEGRSLYQEDTVGTLLPADTLMETYAGRAGARLKPGQAMLCGTVATKTGIRPAHRFEMTLEDPVRGRSLSHAYDIETLPSVR